MMKQRILASLTALVLLLSGCFAAAETAGPAETTSPEDEHPFLWEITEDDPAIAYVLVTLSYSAGLLPLPLEGEYTKTIRQVLPDGSEYINVLHLTPEGFRMDRSGALSFARRYWFSDLVR